MNDNIFLIFYTGGTVEEYESVTLSNIQSLLKNKNFDTKHKKTVFYTPGYKEPINAETSMSIISSYLDTKQYNVLQVNWTKYSMSEHYFQIAVPLTHQVGKKLAKAIEKLLATNELDRNDINLVGHSLGAQISGSIARNLLQPIPLVVGLDPAGPGFSWTTNHLCKSDAKYVLVIHTDVGIYGTTLNDANLDLHFNGGMRPQPGCTIFTIPFSLTPEDGCSHQKSTYYWAAIIRYPGIFKAIKCESTQFFGKTKCYKSKPITIGPDMQRINGVYYLHTSSKYPYGLDLLGIERIK